MSDEKTKKVAISIKSMCLYLTVVDQKKADECNTLKKFDAFLKGSGYEATGWHLMEYEEQGIEHRLEWKRVVADE